MISVLILLCALAPGPGGRCVTPSELARVLQAVHDVGWMETTERDLQKLIPVTLTRSEAQIPAGSIYRTSGCTGTVYLEYKTSKCSVRLIFSQHPAPADSCNETLDTIRAEVEAEPRDAEAGRLAIIAALRAAGTISDVPYEYQWRSDDSRTRFILETFVTDSKSKGLKKLDVWLSHISVQPATVDHLPFHKGYFPPVCDKP
jgi:hypothetical protein